MSYKFLITSDFRSIPIHSNEAKKIIKQYLLHLNGGSNTSSESTKITQLSKFLEETNPNTLFEIVYECSPNEIEDQEDLQLLLQEQTAINRDIIRFKSIFEYDGNQKFIIIGDSQHGSNFQTTIEILLDNKIISNDNLQNVTIFSEKINSHLKSKIIGNCRLFDLDNNTFTTGEDFGLTMQEFYNMRCFYANIVWANFIKKNAGDGVNIICVGTDHIRDIDEQNLDGSPLFALPLQVHLQNYKNVKCEVMVIANDENVMEETTEINENNSTKSIPKLINLNSTAIFMKI